MYIDETIFVSIASFRDVKCFDTLKSIYHNADNPDSIYCGIFTQIDHDSKDERCYDPHFQYNSNVRRTSIHYSDAKGPLWARVKIIKELYQNEKYFLMIDAHTTFAFGWDTELKKYMRFLKQSGVGKPIISTYPPTQEEGGDSTKISSESPLLCKIITGERYPLVLQSVHKPTGYFYRGYLVAGGFLFSDGSYMKDIDIDKLLNLSYIHSGEEYLFAVLAYVNGYDIYSPPKNVLYHKYKSNEYKAEEKTNWESLADIDDTKKIDSYNTLEQLLTTNALDNVRKATDLLNIVKGNHERFENFEHLCNLDEKIEYDS